MYSYFHWGDNSHLIVFLFRKVAALSKNFYVTPEALILKKSCRYETDEISRYKRADRKEMARILAYFQMEKIEVLFMCIYLATP